METKLFLFIFFIFEVPDRLIKVFLNNKNKF